MREMRTLLASSYASNTANLDAFAKFEVMAARQEQAERRLNVGNGGVIGAQNQLAQIAANVAKSNQEIRAMNQRRLIQIFIADPDDNVPLDKALLYKGEPKFTDLTDQELFFEIDIKTVLDAHNAERVKLVNKKVKERTEYLEPARIRDLKMTVVLIAAF